MAFFQLRSSWPWCALYWFSSNAWSRFAAASDVAAFLRYSWRRYSSRSRRCFPWSRPCVAVSLNIFSSVISLSKLNTRRSFRLRFYPPSLSALRLNFRCNALLPISLLAALLWWPFTLRALQFFLSALLDVVALGNEVFKQYVEFTTLFADASCHFLCGIFVASLLENRFELVRCHLGFDVDVDVWNGMMGSIIRK